MWQSNIESKAYNRRKQLYLKTRLHLLHDFERCIDDIEEERDNTRESISLFTYKTKRHSMLQMSLGFFIAIDQFIGKLTCHCISCKKSIKLKLPNIGTIFTRKMSGERYATIF